MNICYECRIKLGHKRKDNGSHTSRKCKCDVCGKVKSILPSRHWKEGQIMELSKENQEWLESRDDYMYPLDSDLGEWVVESCYVKEKLLKDQQKIEELEKENSELKIEKAKLFLRLGDMAEDNKQ